MYTLGPQKRKKENSYYVLNKTYNLDYCFVYNKDGTHVGQLERSSPKDGWLLYDATYHCQASFSSLEEAETKIKGFNGLIRDFHLYS